MLCNILYWNMESFVSDVTVNGINYRCERSVLLMPMLTILIWDAGGFVPFKIKILYAFLFVKLLNSSFFLSFILISSVVATDSIFFFHVEGMAFSREKYCKKYVLILYFSTNCSYV